MKIVWLAHRDPNYSPAGGAEESIRAIGSGLVARGHQVLVISPRRGTQSRGDVADGVNIRRVSTSVATHLLVPLILRQIPPPDVVVEDLGHVVPWLTNRFSRVPAVAFFRHLHARTLNGQVSSPLRLALGGIEKMYPLLYRLSPFDAPSDTARSDLEGLGVKPNMITRIEYGVDTETFRPGVPTETPSLIHFAGLRPYKRPSHALLLVRALRTRGISASLTLVGDGVELGRLKALARKLDIVDSVEFPGRVSRTELARLVARSWVHIQCSLSEGWGLTVAESAICGVPTVGYAVPGLVDSVKPGRTGILVEEGNIDALAEAAEEILRKGEDWRRSCLKSASTRSWQTVAQEWDSFLSDLLNRRSGS
jgi:glycosyltransferase involved in cell wall biosynthesis